MKRGLFIVFEGIDRCGKTTQVQRLVSNLYKKSISTELMKFPSKFKNKNSAIIVY